MEEIIPKKFIIQAGLLAAIVSIVFTIMLYSLDAHYDSGIGNLVVSLIILFSAIIWGTYEFKKANSGFISINETLKIGTGVSLIIALTSTMFLYILANIIEPEYWNIVHENLFNKVLETNPELMGDMSLNEFLEQRTPTIWFYYFAGITINLLIGFFFSFILGLIIKKEKH
mgnify:CR=1 FL=1